MANHKFLRQLGLFTIPQFLTAEECVQWRALAADSGGTEAKVYIGKEAVVDDQHRKTLDVAVKNPVRLELEQRISTLQADLEEQFGVVLNGLSHLNCLMYRPGDFFHLHSDIPAPGTVEDSDKLHYLTRRCVSVVIFLNDPNHEAEPYQGGVLSFYGLMDGPVSGTFGFPVEAESGLLVAFPAAMLHEVSPVTEGRRYTLVTWFLAGDPKKEDRDAGDPNIQA